MNGTIASGSILIEAFNSVLQDMELSCDVVVCPPFTAIERAVALTRDTAIAVGAQTMDYHDAGAFTGEISPLMLTEVGVNYVIIGHLNAVNIMAKQMRPLMQRLKVHSIII